MILVGVNAMIRAIRLELVKPLSESWDEAGPILRLLAKATPKLLNAAYEARVACGVAGAAAVKEAVAPDAKAASGDGLAYQATLRAVERLRAWGEKKRHAFAKLDVPGGMTSAIARAACQAYARRDQEHSRFASERILVRATETKLAKDPRGVVVSLQLRPAGRVTFATAYSRGKHYEAVKAIIAHDCAAAGCGKQEGKREAYHAPWHPGDCKLQYDRERGKWYALIAYEAPVREVVKLDSGKTLAVHRGVRNALYMLGTSGQSAALSGGKFMAQRRHLQVRTREIRRISVDELGRGAKGHGKSRRLERYSVLEDKIGRVTGTFCQQAAARVSRLAREWGCGVVMIEDYGGIEPHADRTMRRVLDRFPLHEMKLAIQHRLELDCIELRESPSEYISSTCPRCANADMRQHNVRTNTFHCSACGFERPADWVAAWWLLKHGGGDMTELESRLARELELARQLRGAAE